MSKIETSPYSEYRLMDVIGRLEGFRGTIGWGELNEDLEVAIDCLEYVLKAMKEEDTALENEIHEATKPPHWIVDDHGFAGKYFRCSVCGKGYWTGSDPSSIHVTDHCLNCKVIMNPDEIEYREAT